MNINEQMGSTSSIQASWPPVEASNERLRGFYPSVLHSGYDLEAFADEWHSLRNHTEHDNIITRLSVRVVLPAYSLTRLENLGVGIESMLPIRDSADVIAYTGWNTTEREMSNTAMQQHRERLTSLLFERSSPGSLRTPDDTFKAGIIDEHTSDKFRLSMCEQFEDLYSAFGYDRQEVRQLFENPANTIAYITDGDRVISTALAEQATLEVQGHRPIRVAEITEAITHPDYRGQGLYRFISGRLIGRIVQLHNHGNFRLDVLYGESNLAMTGVLKAAHQNGRCFSIFDTVARTLHNPNFGILPQNFRVEDDIETRRYNDFATSFVPLERL